MKSNSRKVNHEIKRQKRLGKSQQQNGENDYAVFDRMLEGVQILGHDWRYLYLNAAVEVHNRRPNRELLGNRFMDMWPGIEETHVFSLIKRCMEKRDPSQLENRFVYPDGKVGWFTLSIQPVPEGVLIMSFDVTERVQAENALRRREEHYRKLTENFPNGTVNIYDRDLRTTFVAGGDLKKYNMNPEAFIGKTFHELAPAETFSIAEPHLRAAFEGKSGSYETPYWDGRYYLVNVAPLESADGSINEILVVTQNLTERKQMEDNLLKTQEQLILAIRSANVGLWDWDLQSNEVYYSPEWKSQLGYEDHEVSNDLSEWESRVHPEDLERARNTISKYLEKPYQNYFNEFRMRHKDGSYRWILAQASTINDEQGKPIRMIGSHIDITERKQADEALRESEESYSLLFENMMNGFALHEIVLNEEGKPVDYIFLEINDAFERMTGLERENILGKKVTQVIPDIKNDPADWIGRYGEVTLTGKDIRFEQKSAPIGKWYSVLAFRPMKGQFATIFEDITERKQMETVLAENEHRFRGLIDHAPDGIVIYGSSGRIEYASPATERIMGYATEEILATDPAQITHPDDLPALDQVLAELMQTPGKTITKEYRMRHKDGSWRWLESNISNFSDESGVEGLVFNFRDISERKSAEREIRQYTEDLLLINSLNNAANRSENIEDIIEVFASETRKIFDCLAVSVYLLSPDEKYLEMQSFTIPRDMTDKIEKLIGQPIPRVRVPIKAGSLLKQILENESGTLLNEPKVIRQWIEEFSETSFLPAAFRPVVKKLAPQIYKILNIGSAISIPLNASGRAIGLMDMSSKGQFTEDDLHRIRNIESQVTAVLLRKQVEKQVKLQLERMRALSDIDRAISSSLDMRVSLDVLLKEVLSQLEVDAAAVLLLHSATQTLEFVAGKGFRSPAIRQSRVRLGEDFAGKVGMKRQMLHIPNLIEVGERFKEDKFVEYYGVPLIAQGTLKGVLEIYQRTSLDIDLEWKNYLETLSGQAAIAIDNAQLFEGVQRSNQELIMAYDATIAGWSRAMDLRDKETEGHTQRVTELTLKLAEKFGNSKQEQAQIRRGALLHDIGKLGVPDHILLKPGKLTDEEWEIMRQHPNFAYEMLMPIVYLRPALDIPYCHHEKWDGSGYPRGLKGEQIPLAARIFAVIDVWDALTSDRPYRDAWTAEKTLKYIKEQSGKHFDPDVVDIFLETISQDTK